MRSACDTRRCDYLASIGIGTLRRVKPTGTRTQPLEFGTRCAEFINLHSECEKVLSEQRLGVVARLPPFFLNLENRRDFRKRET